MKSIPETNISLTSTLYLLVQCQTEKQIQPYKQAFIQALSFKAFFPQRFSFFIVYLAQWLDGVASWQTPKGKCLEFRSADCYKMHFLEFFLEFQSFIGSFEEKLTRQVHTTFPHACHQRVRRISEQNGTPFNNFSKTNKRKKHT